MNLYNIIKKYFNEGSVCVVGERGKGKDMFFANIIARRKLPYVSNTEYKVKSKIPLTWYPLDFKSIDCGGNTYKNFIEGDIKPYKYPYPMGADVYISDVGVVLPSQFCNELNRDYKHLATFSALSRQIAKCSMHINTQSLNRCYDKLREQSRTYITCLKCKVLPLGKKHQFVIQKIRIHEKYESCLANVPKLKLPFYVRFGRDRMMAQLYELNYQISHGKIEEYTLFYFNKSDYDTNVFKTMLERGLNDEENIS